MKNSCMTILSIGEDNGMISWNFSVENEVHVHEWMQLFISGCLGNILYKWLRTVFEIIL